MQKQASNANAGQVLLGPDVVECLGSRITVKQIGELPLKGKAKPLMIYELTGINDTVKSSETKSSYSVKTRNNKIGISKPKNEEPKKETPKRDYREYI